LKRLINRIDRNILLCLIDMAIVFCCYSATWLMVIASREMKWQMVEYLLSVGSAIVVNAVFMQLFRVNTTIWRYSGGRDFIRVFIVACVSGIVSTIIFELVTKNAPHFNLLYSGFALLFAAAMLTLSRITYREYSDRNTKAIDKPKTRLVIVGAGSAGYRMADEIIKNSASGLLPVAFVDDDETKINRTIERVPVMGRIADIGEVCTVMKADMIYIAIPSASNEQRATILDHCAKTKLPVKILPFIAEISREKDIADKVRDITPEELLGRDPINVADEKVMANISGRTVLITGGGGSIGSELCRQIAAHNPKKLILVDIYENTTYEIQQELKGKYGDSLNLAVYIADVCDTEKLEHLFKREKPDMVLHAAAHKHVPLMEVVPDEAVLNNVFGTFSCAQAANNSGVDRFVLISTDKAVHPTNVMGATKRVCEMVVQYFNTVSRGTIFSAVRFGNVLGSHGSVVPLFKEQIEKRRDITVTHPEIIRYFMTIPEAAKLVLTAGAMAEGGEIFVLDMGKPVKIDDLARKMISLAGLTVGKDINIKYVGLRPGEKLFEELLMSEEGLKKTQSDRIFIGSAIKMDYEGFMQKLDALKSLCRKAGVSGDDVAASLKELVPTFKRYVPATIKIEDKK